MKKTITMVALSMVVLLISASTSMVLAQDDSSYQDRAEERRELFEENSQERQDNRETRRDNIAQRHALRLTNRFSFYNQRLSTIAGKIDAQLTNLASEGKDITAAAAKLDEAELTLDEANSLSDQSIAAFEAIEPAEYDAQRDQALAVSDLAQQAREDYKTAVVLMKEAVSLAKNAQ